MQEYQSKWYKKNKEIVKLKSREYYSKNKDKKEFIEKRRKQGQIYREKSKEYDKYRIKKWRLENKDKVNRYMRNYRKKSNTIKMKINARNKSKKYIKIPTGQICQDCMLNLATERHHDDYDKPLKVKFLCSECHGKIGRIK